MACVRDPQGADEGAMRAMWGRRRKRVECDAVEEEHEQELSKSSAMRDCVARLSRRERTGALTRRTSESGGRCCGGPRCEYCAAPEPGSDRQLEPGARFISSSTAFRPHRSATAQTAMADHQEQQAAEQHTGDEQRQLNDEDEQPIFLTEDDVLEVEDMADGDDRMDDDSDDDGNNEAGPSGEQQGDDDRDDAMDLLDGGFDDSVALAQLHRSEGGAVFCLAVHPFAATLAVSGGEDDQAFVFRTDTGAQVAQLSGHTDSVTSVAWSHDGALVATGGMDGKVNVWKARRPSSDMAWEETGWEFLISLEGPDEVNVRPPCSLVCIEPVADLSRRAVDRLAPEGQCSAGRRSRRDCVGVEPCVASTLRILQSHLTDPGSTGSPVWRNNARAVWPYLTRNLRSLHS